MNELENVDNINIDDLYNRIVTLIENAKRNVPDIADININRLSKKRDEKILKEIIKPKDNLINELYQDKLILQQELLRKSKMFEKAEKYQKERDNIMADNEALHNQEEKIKSEYKRNLISNRNIKVKLKV